MPVPLTSAHAISIIRTNTGAVSRRVTTISRKLLPVYTVSVAYVNHPYRDFLLRYVISIALDNNFSCTHTIV